MKDLKEKGTEESKVVNSAPKRKVEHSTKSNVELPAETAKLFEITSGVTKPVIKWRHYPTIDLTKIDVGYAQVLVKDGFPYLKEK